MKQTLDQIVATPEEAVLEAGEKGEELDVVTASDGSKLVQRPVDWNKKDKPPRKRRGKRVKIYHKRRTKMFLTDCTVGPNEEASILATDARNPNVAPHIVVIE